MNDVKLLIDEKVIRCLTEDQNSSNLAEVTIGKKAVRVCNGIYELLQGIVEYSDYQLSAIEAAKILLKYLEISFEDPEIKHYMEVIK